LPGSPSHPKSRWHSSLCPSRRRRPACHRPTRRPARCDWHRRSARR
jgi:hypothetical protein